MNFLYPYAFTGLISVPIIIAMYLFKQKYTEMQMPSLFLWQAAVSNNESQRPWQKLRKNILMILQIIIAVLVTLAIANPFMTGQAKSSSGIIVLDCSMSMQAKDEKPNRFESAKNSLEKLVKDMGVDDELSLIVMQKNPYIAVSAAKDKQQLLSALKNITASNTAADFEQTLALIESINSNNTSNLYFFSDDAGLDFGSMNVKKNIFGNSIQNTAITIFSYKIENNKLICLAKVKNFGDESIENSLVLYVNGVVHDIADFSLSPMDEKEIFIPDLPVTALDIEAKLSKGDMMETDDTAYLSINENMPKKVLLFTEQNIFLENMIRILPNIELYKGSQDSMENLSGYFLYVFDGTLPENLPTDGHILLFNPPVGNNIVATGEDIEIQDYTIESTAAFRFINGIDFSVKNSKDISMPDWADENVMMGNDLILTAGNRENQKIMIIGFDLHNTDLPLRKEYPVFMYNIFRWFIPESVISIDSVICGESINFDILPGARSASVISPDKTVSAIAPPFPADTYYDTNKPGIYVLEQKDGEKTIYSKFAVNAFNENESNLLRDNVSEGQNNSVATKGGTHKYFKNIIIFLIILVVIAEWWVYSRGI